jgi:hypothetical protein
MLTRSTDASGVGTASFPPIIQALIALPIEDSGLIAIPPVGGYGLSMPG